MERSQAAELFEQVRREFEQRGLLGQVLRLNLEGKTYSARCDDQCFSLYRITEKPHLPPGLPGWTVCRLGSGECFSLDPEQEFNAGEVSEPDSEAALVWAEAVLAVLDNLGNQST
jgi:hypothetical protein